VREQVNVAACLGKMVNSAWAGDVRWVCNQAGWTETPPSSALATANFTNYFRVIFRHSFGWVVNRLGWEETADRHQHDGNANANATTRCSSGG
jgi:hypothetical protein